MGTNVSAKWETMAYPIVCLVIAFWNVCRFSSQCYCTLSVLLLHHRCKQRRCYCSISWINNRRFRSQIKPPGWAIHSLKSINSHSILLHTDIYCSSVSLCYSATSSITGKSVRHVEWVRNSCYCIEALPRVCMSNFLYIFYLVFSKKLGMKMRNCSRKLRIYDNRWWGRRDIYVLTKIPLVHFNEQAMIILLDVIKMLSFYRNP